MENRNDIMASMDEFVEKYNRKMPATRKAFAEYINKRLSHRELLEQLAEEAAELTQAALKKIRADKLSTNYTPVTEAKALSDLKEEICDVLVVLKVMGLLDVTSDTECDIKLMRWAERLGYIKE